MSLRARVVAGLGWTAAGRLTSQVVAWSVSIVVMRILEPTDYGLLAMSTTVTAFIGLFAELGLGWAVVHARSVDTDTLKRVFGLILVVNAALFLLAYCTAPLVASFYGEPRVAAVIRAASVQLLIATPGAIPDSLLQRSMRFKARSIVEASGTVVGGICMLALAFGGFGIWALVAGTLIVAVWRSIGMNLIEPFLHAPSFALRGLGALCTFGRDVAVSRVLLYVCIQADTILGGRYLGKEQIGYYSVGMHLASLPMQRVSAVLNDVAFPAFAQIQDERERVRAYVLRSIRLLSLFAFPVFWGMAAVAPETVSLLLGEKWTPAIVPLQMLALMMPLRMVAQLMPPTLQGIGEARLVARNQLLACVVMGCGFVVGMRYGIVGLSAAWLVAFPIVFLANARSWFPVLGVHTREIFAAMTKPALASAGMCGAVSAVRAFEPETDALLLVLLIATGVAAYAILSLAINRPGLRDVAVLLGRAPGSVRHSEP